MTDTFDAVARKRRARTFQRHERAAQEGIHLPSNEELMRGMSFFGGTLKLDAREFATRAMARLKAQKAEDSLLYAALGILTVSYEDTDFLRVRDGFEAHPCTSRTEEFLTDGKLRCEYYAACVGDPPSMLRVAAHVAYLAEAYVTPPEVAYDFLVGALGWLRIAAKPFRRRMNFHSDIHRLGEELLETLNTERDRRSKILIASINEELPGSLTSSTPNPEPPVNDHRAEPKQVVIIENVGNADVNQGGQVRREFSSLIGTLLPLCPVPTLPDVRQKLASQYPHLIELIDHVLLSLVSEDHVRLRPMLFVGPAGCGKTTFAQRLLQALHVPCEVFPCGGIGDSSLMGTARRWASGEPSLPLSLIRRFNVASPGIVLDELEKAGESRYHGTLHDCLLGLLEPQSASLWRDPYLQSPIDLSHVIWIATANSLQGIPRTLLDRMTYIDFPVPRIEHLEQIANNLIMEMIQRRNLDKRWFQPLTPEELGSLQTAWTGGSIRQLQRLVEVVYKTRDEWSRRH